MKDKAKRSRWWLLPLSLLALLALAELILRLVWTPQSMVEDVARLRPFYVVESQENGVTTYVTNGNPPSKVISYNPDDPRQLSALRFVMPKPAGLVRIFVMGSSPIYGGIGWSANNLSYYLMRDLQAARPDLQFEILNAAAQQMNSKTLTEIFQEIDVFAPDFILIYIGGAVPSLEAPGSHEMTDLEPVFFYVAEFVQDLRLVYLLGPTTQRKIVDFFYVLDEKAVTGLKDEVNVAANMRRMSQESLIDGYRKLVAQAAASSSKVAFYEVVTDLAGTPPLWSLHDKKLSKQDKNDYKELLDSAERLIKDGDHDQAIAKLEQALVIDDAYAKTHYLLGQALLAAGRGDEAYQAFIDAREKDASHERLFAEPIDVLREVLNKHHLTLLPTEERFRQLSETGVPGSDLFHDITHPSTKGLAVLGRIGVEWMLPLLPPGGEGLPEPLPEL